MPRKKPAGRKWHPPTKPQMLARKNYFNKVNKKKVKGKEPQALRGKPKSHITKKAMENKFEGFVHRPEGREMLKELRKTHKKLKRQKKILESQDGQLRNPYGIPQPTQGVATYPVMKTRAKVPVTKRGRKTGKLRKNPALSKKRMST